MKTIAFKGYRFSQLTLGTVQLGMPYGISNSQGMPDDREALDMLRTAVDAGITTFDTARQYGASEAVLGRFLAGHTEADLNMVSKFKIAPQDAGALERAWKSVEGSVRASIECLGISKLPVCLLHKGEEPMDAVAGILPVIISRLREQGLIDIGGVSVYEPADVAFCLAEPLVEAVQVPVNVFDQRLVVSGALQRLAKAQKLVFARSVFLQGLFFMDPGQITGNLISAVPFLKQLHTFVKEYRADIAGLAFSYVRDLPGIDSIVVGAATSAQLAENVKLLGAPEIPASLRDEFMKVFTAVPDEILTPGRWKI
ncbi:aldo/keto reductase [Dyadobacter sp. BHUBP1]|uniref:aldo/keto reductase n=1 Tax=Dyadobacter sp. BHUBP1 TaxID=3424178 RepID=UPI003D347BAE